MGMMVNWVSVFNRATKFECLPFQKLPSMLKWVHTAFSTPGARGYLGHMTNHLSPQSSWGRGGEMNEGYWTERSSTPVSNAYALSIMSSAAATLSSAKGAPSVSSYPILYRMVRSSWLMPCVSSSGTLDSAATASVTSSWGRRACVPWLAWA